ncbi:hypothetical protein EDB83DRAFT_2547276 [Lactarius deliciosus]|nr:hypothetical protein EDB83DRAFT_2547276 [Lactarius deliciosus]
MSKPSPRSSGVPRAIPFLLREQSWEGAFLVVSMRIGLGVIVVPGSRVGRRQARQKQVPGGHAIGWEMVGDLRAVTSASLYQDELRYRVGELSWPLWTDHGGEDMSGSLVGPSGQQSRKFVFT